jgi:molybdenum cofactor cytidylyltransferase
MSSTNTAIIILAAGSSSRLGRPKQLLSYQHKSLLDNTIEEAKKATDGAVLVILGGNHALIEKNITRSAISIVYNPDWEEGMSSSIRLGLAVLKNENAALKNVILTVCDQPFITAEVFGGLIQEAETSGKGIVASSYGGTLGTPVWFDQLYFNELFLLKGTEGAKKVVKKFAAQVASVTFEKGEIDIDTPEDYNRLLNTI